MKVPRTNFLFSTRTRSAAQHSRSSARVMATGAAKRYKQASNSTPLQEINHHLQTIQSYADYFQQNNLPAGGALVEKLLSELGGIVKYLSQEVPQVISKQEVLETIFFGIQHQLSAFLPLTSLLYLAATSKKFFKLFLPIVSPLNLKYSVLVEYRKINNKASVAPHHQLKHLQPKSISQVCDLKYLSISKFVTEIKFGAEFDSPLENLPNSLTHITFGQNFNQQVHNCLPNSLTHLTFGDNFNQNVDHLPHQLTHLRFGKFFNLGVDHLPLTLTHLYFSPNNYYRLSMDHLPNSLIHLEFGNMSQIPNQLPNSIQTLKFESVRNGEFTSLPSSLRSIHQARGEDIKFFAKGVLPPTLKSFTGYHITTQDLPPSITSLAVSIPRTPSALFLASLPPYLQELRLFGNWYNSNTLLVPPSLTKLEMNITSFNAPLNKLPPTVTDLYFAPRCEYNLENDLPLSLTRLCLGNKFNSPVDKLPPNLTHIIFGDDFNQKVDHLPRLLTYIKFGISFNQPVDSLPPLLAHLLLGDTFNKTLTSLPQHLKILQLSMEFNQQLIVPPFLTHLAFGNFFDPEIALPPTLTHLQVPLFTTSFYFPPSLKELSVRGPGVSFNTIFWRNRVELKKMF